MKEENPRGIMRDLFSPIIEKKDYRELTGVFDIAIYDPPFDIWKDVQVVPKAKTIIAFTNFQNRHYVQSLFGNPRFECIWFFRDGRWVSHKLPRLTHEHILIYGDIDKECYVMEGAKDKSSQKKGKGCIGRDKNLGDRVYIPRDKKMLNSVIEVPRNVGKELGVRGKPKKLADILLDWLGAEGKTVRDGFAGSGTFGKSAIERSMSYAGCDIAHND